VALELSFRPIDADTPTRGFCCGARELDRFMTSGRALRDHRAGAVLTTCAYLPGILAPVGFYSITSVAESAKHLPGKYRLFGGGDHFPALQLVYLGVQRPHQGQEIGTSMAGAVVAMFADLGQRLGIPHLILVPISDEVIPFYRDRLGFSCYKGTDRMYLPLQSAVDAMSVPAESETGELFP
jgi:hypothetical protein